MTLELSAVEEANENFIGNQKHHFHMLGNYLLNAAHGVSWGFILVMYKKQGITHHMHSRKVLWTTRKIEKILTRDSPRALI